MQHMSKQNLHDDEGERLKLVPLNINTVDGLKTHQLWNIINFRVCLILLLDGSKYRICLALWVFLVFSSVIFHCTFTSFYGDGYNTQLRQGVAFISIQGIMNWQRLGFGRKTGLEGPGNGTAWVMESPKLGSWPCVLDAILRRILGVS